MEWYLEEIAKSYGKKEALKPTTLRLKRGIYGLLGPNGAGKSTPRPKAPGSWSRLS